MFYTQKPGANPFQPTPSLRRATRTVISTSASKIISTHALLAEGDDEHHQHPEIPALISTHALLAEGDTIMRDDSAKHM